MRGDTSRGLLIIQILQSGVSLIGGGHVHKGQTDTGHDLEHETKSTCRYRKHKTSCPALAGTVWPAVDSKSLLTCNRSSIHRAMFLSMRDSFFGTSGMHI